MEKQKKRSVKYNLRTVAYPERKLLSIGWEMRKNLLTVMLLYAKTDEEITPDCRYQIDGNRISVKTLDLDTDFTEIKTQLDHVINEWLG
ncbi:MAG: hypothetical protein LLF96_11580 [Eubacteriales bacterium]|nr:hypothetical protein [Eubacteriales bacterium]